MSSFERVFSGCEGFDRIVDCIRMGDNVVWQTDTILSYSKFVIPFAEKSIRDKRNLIYVRFAGHSPLLEPRDGLKIVELDPETGFENFTVKVHELITKEGRDAFYIFDSLSELQSAWASDLMMGNFFHVTCPYLFELNTVAFFAIIRNRHSFDAVARIRETTQLLLDVYSEGDLLYVHPLKVWNRYGTTMFMPHLLFDGGQSEKPLTDSMAAGKFYEMMNQRGFSDVNCALDHFDRFFIAAKDELERSGENRKTRERLCSMLLGRDQKIQSLSVAELTTTDLLRVKSRLIGSGQIGGKAAGLLLSRKVVENHVPNLRLEPHDSFYVGTDVFYSYMVNNGWWKLRLKQRTATGFFSAGKELCDKLATGEFPVGIREAFRRMLSYFGQSSIIVRSSSMLEDSFSNAFAGKYESVFCVNRGNPEDNLIAFENAVRHVYASSMNESALAYRKQRKLDELDEQMAILVQRVSGSVYSDIFMPSAAGVGYSHNAYVWNADIDPSAGMLRLVGGLGTRAVDRTATDYPRIVPLNSPLLTPLASNSDRAQYSQKNFDVLDLTENRIRTIPITELTPKLPTFLHDLLYEHDLDAESFFRERGDYKNVYFCNCQKVIENPSFISDMNLMLKTLEKVYEYPVDIEFTVIFDENRNYQINLLQCRPLQTIKLGGKRTNMEHCPDDQVFFSVESHTMGDSMDIPVDYVVTVDPSAYYSLSVRDKYQTARDVGTINRVLAGRKIVLLGPGRWGTRSPELGVPVNFAEISNIAAICEVSFADGNVMPELSYGSHFFQDLVETGMLYCALMEGAPGCLYRPEWMSGLPNISTALLKNFSPCLTVYDVSSRGLRLRSDLVARKAVCAQWGGEPSA